MKANIPKEEVSKFDKLIQTHVAGLFELAGQYQKIFNMKCKNENFVEDLKNNPNVNDEMRELLLKEGCLAYMQLLFSMCMKTVSMMGEKKE